MAQNKNPQTDNRPFEENSNPAQYTNPAQDNNPVQYTDPTRAGSPIQDNNPVHYTDPSRDTSPVPYTSTTQDTATKQEHVPFGNRPFTPGEQYPQNTYGPANQYGAQDKPKSADDERVLTALSGVHSNARDIVVQSHVSVGTNLYFVRYSYDAAGTQREVKALVFDDGEFTSVFGGL